MFSFYFSVGYTNHDVIYRWNTARQVAIAEDMKLSQFDLIATPAANHTDSILNSASQSGENTNFSKIYFAPGILS